MKGPQFEFRDVGFSRIAVLPDVRAEEGADLVLCAAEFRPGKVCGECRRLTESPARVCLRRLWKVLDPDSSDAAYLA